MPNSNPAKMQMPLAIPSFVEFSTSKSPIRFYEDPYFTHLDMCEADWVTIG
jgi:hypothetical protein